jgi:hypothetical protein
VVKGTSRRVIVVDSPDPQVFEQAIFIVRSDALFGEGVTSQQLVNEACRVAKNYSRRHTVRRSHRLPPWVWSLAGAAGIGAAWLTASLL